MFNLVQPLLFYFGVLIEKFRVTYVVFVFVLIDCHSRPSPIIYVKLCKIWAYFNMYTSSSFKAAMAVVLFLQGFSVLATKRPVRAPTFTVSTYASEATGFPHVGRDGGGGGVVNGKNFIVYSDTATANAAGGMANFSFNSYAFVPDPKKPLTLQDFGSSEKPKVLVEVVPWYGNETCKNNFIWPNSKPANLVPLQRMRADIDSLKILSSLVITIRTLNKRMRSTLWASALRMALVHSSTIL